MLDGFRVLGIFLGGIMFLSVFAPSSEPPSTLDIIFFSLFALTGLLLVVPYKIVNNINKLAIFRNVLIVSVLVTFLSHCIILLEAGAGLKSSMIILLVIYPVVCCNVFWYHRKTITKLSTDAGKAS